MAQREVAGKRIRLVQGDITALEVEAFVFDITEDCQLGSGYGAAIVSRGGKVVQDELTAIGRCATGEAVATGAGRMKVKHILHTNGPKFFEPDTEGKLAAATRACLKLAEEKGVTQLAFPPIGTGLYQVPLDLCARVMVDTVAEHLAGETSLEEVLFVALDTREHEPFEHQISAGR